MRIGILQSENKVGWKFWRKGDDVCWYLPETKCMTYLMCWCFDDFMAVRPVDSEVSVFFTVFIIWFVWFYVNIVVLCVFLRFRNCWLFPQPKTSLTHLAHMLFFTSKQPRHLCNNVGLVARQVDACESYVKRGSAINVERRWRVLVAGNIMINQTCVL